MMATSIWEIILGSDFRKQEQSPQTWQQKCALAIEIENLVSEIYF